MIATRPRRDPTIPRSHLDISEWSEPAHDPLRYQLSRPDAPADGAQRARHRLWTQTLLDDAAQRRRTPTAPGAAPHDPVALALARLGDEIAIARRHGVEVSLVGSTPSTDVTVAANLVLATPSDILLLDTSDAELADKIERHVKRRRPMPIRAFDLDSPAPTGRGWHLLRDLLHAELHDFARTRDGALRPRHPDLLIELAGLTIETLGSRQPGALARVVGATAKTTAAALTMALDIPRPVVEERGPWRYQSDIRAEHRRRFPSEHVEPYHHNPYR